MARAIAKLVKQLINCDFMGSFMVGNCSHGRRAKARDDVAADVRRRTWGESGPEIRLLTSSATWMRSRRPVFRSQPPHGVRLTVELFAFKVIGQIGLAERWEQLIPGLERILDALFLQVQIG